MEKTPDKMKSLQTSKTEHYPIKSKAIIKHSSVIRPTSIAYLPCNTDLNLIPSNWLRVTAESYGLQYTQISRPKDFTSFQLAHMFPDCIGEVDVVSDAENIKQLLKIPYSNDSISMMVHQIENTLLIDEFDIDNYLTVLTNKDWEWLRNFFYNDVVESFERKEKCFTRQVKTLDVIQKKTLNAKFLHHSIADLSNSASNNEYPIVLDCPTLSAPSLPEPLPEEKFPGFPITHQLFNQNVLWNFEYLRMMLGTDLPIFGGDNSTSFSLRLSDVSTTIDVLTCIDYWLDNLMCNIPEIVICNHLNGIVQKYEQVKTEDLPHLNNSKFSPEVIKDVAQNIMSFLKSNTTKAGHTYWLFKGKNDDKVKLYDLTTLCSKSLIEERCKGQNPFTVPVTMLLYRVARNLIHNLNDKKTSSPVSVHSLLNNCLKLLNKTEYPQIATSIYYMLADLYIPSSFNSIISSYEELTNVSKNCITMNVNSIDGSLYWSNEDKHIYSIDERSLCLSHEKKNNSKKSRYSSSKYVVYTLEERCQKALYYIGCGLECLQYFKNLNPQLTKEENLKETKGEPIKALSEAVPLGVSDTDENNTKKAKIINESLKDKELKNKNSKKFNKKKIIVENSSNVIKTVRFMSVAETMPTWHNPPNDKDNISWITHLSVLLYEKASFSYVALAQHEFQYEKYGEALKHFRSVFKCRMCMVDTSVYDTMFGFSLGNSADCCLLIARHWGNVEQYTNELKSNWEYEYRVQEALLNEYNKCKLNDITLIPRHLSSKINLLKSAEMCYKRSFDLELELPNNYKTVWIKRLGNVYAEIISCYIEEISSCQIDNFELTSLRLQWLINQSKHYFSLGNDISKNVGDIINLAILHSNMGRLYSNVIYYSFQFIHHYRKFIKDGDYFNMAVENYLKSMEVLDNRLINPKIWDMVHWDLASILLNMAVQLQTDPFAFSDKDEGEREVISLLLKALKYSESENDSCRKLLYKYQTAYIHERLAFLYHNRLRFLEVDIPKFKKNLHQCMSHYSISLEIFMKINKPYESLEILIKRFSIDEFQLGYATNDQSKMKHVMSFVENFGKCVEVLKMLFENQNSEGNLVGEKKTQDLLIMLEKRTQYILKCMIKLAISSKTSKLANKTNQLKIIYGEMLRKSNKENDYTYLLVTLTQITELGW